MGLAGVPVRESSGPSEIYVRPFPDVERGRRQISTSGGTRPMWADSTSAFSHGNPRVVADTPTWAPLPGRSYDVSPDGLRFLMLKERERRTAAETPSQLIVVLNWLEELKRLAPAN
jgi:eukaryotic-like serine/threonine-protein kinase